MRQWIYAILVLGLGAAIVIVTSDWINSMAGHVWHGR